MDCRLHAARSAIDADPPPERIRNPDSRRGTGRKNYVTEIVVVSDEPLVNSSILDVEAAVEGRSTSRGEVGELRNVGVDQRYSNTPNEANTGPDTSRGASFSARDPY